MTQAPSSLRGRWVALLVGLLLVVHGVLALTAARGKGFTSDEAFFLMGGYTYWRYNDYRVNPEGGVLTQRLLGLPLLALKPVDVPADAPGWKEGKIAYSFLFAMGNDPDRLLFWGRAMVVGLSCVLGLAVFVWSRKLFGVVGGFVSLILYVFSPTILSNGALATADLSASLFFLLALAGTWWVIQKVSLWRVVVSCLAVGAVVTAKYSGLMIVPMVMILVAGKLIWGGPLPVGRWKVAGRWGRAGVFVGVTAIHVVAVIGWVWLVYGLRFSPFGSGLEPSSRSDLFDMYVSYLGLTRRPILWAMDHHILPESFLHGLAYVGGMSSGRPSFLNGQVTFGSPWFFPYAFLVKTPLGLFAVLALAAWAVIRGVRWGEGRTQVGETAVGGIPIFPGFYRTFPLWVLLGVYWWTAIFSKMNIGVRHLLPTLPMLFILAGAAGAWAASGSGDRVQGSGRGKAGSGHRSKSQTLNPHPSSAASRCAAAILLLALGSYAVEALWMWPDYLAYFNVLAGGPSNGYKHLVDSSLDWGQDLPGLRKWLDANHANNPDTTYLSYAGGDMVPYRRIRAYKLPATDFLSPTLKLYVPQPWRGGVYAISATVLSGALSRPQGPWCRQYEEAYQKARPAMEVLETPDAPGHEQMVDNTPISELATGYTNFCQLRLARLCAYLRHREPDHRIGYSIHIYQMSDQEVALALTGPPRELELQPRVPPLPPQVQAVAYGVQKK